jgi:hypothetical protein
MALRIGINIGFVTNSSSMVYHFPKELLANPEVKAFLDAFELHGGFVGSELWSRDTCTTVAMTKEQKLEVRAKLAESDYGGAPPINADDDSIVVIYGDEYQSIASTLARMLCQIAHKTGVTVSGQDYN